MSKTVTTRFASFAVPAMLTAAVLSGCHHTTASASGPLLGTAHPTYGITDIGVGEPSSLNNNGQIVGMFPAGIFPHSKGFPYFHGFLWNKGKRTEMKTLGGWYSFADTVTDRGLIVGSASLPGQTSKVSAIYHYCLWQNGKLTDLEGQPRFRGAGPLHLTKSGALYVVVRASGLPGQQHLWFYPAGFGPGIGHDLGMIGGKGIFVRAINDSGVVIGVKEEINQPFIKIVGKQPIRRAFLWRKGHFTELGTLGGPNSEAAALNNAGQIVGIADLAQKPTEAPKHAFLWERGKMHDLGALADSGFSYPNAINDKGQVVGFSNISLRSAESHAVIWDNGKIQDLSLLIPDNTPWISLSGADGINDRGQIVGDGSIRGEHWTHGFLMTPNGYKGIRGDSR